MSVDLKEYRPSSISLLIPGMQPLSPDEPCWSLYERDELTADFKRLRRVQTVRVLRNGRLAEFSVDMGPAGEFVAGPFTVVSILEDSVGQALEAADYLRGDNPADMARVMQEHLDEFNVIDAAITQAQQVQEWMRRNKRTTRNLRIQTNSQPRKGRR